MSIEISSQRMSCSTRRDTVSWLISDSLVPWIQVVSSIASTSHFCFTNMTYSGKLHTLCGTPSYLSPEQLDGKFTNGYTNIVDWWSFGVLMFELRTGYTPFCKSSRDTNYEIFLRILKKHISYPWNFDKKSKDLISALCYADPAKRLCDPENIKKHPFFDVAWDAVADRRMIPPYVPKFGAPGDASHFRQYHDPVAAAAAAKEAASPPRDAQKTANDSLEKELKNDYRNGSGDFLDF